MTAPITDEGRIMFADTRTRPARRSLAAAGLLVGVITLAACSGSSGTVTDGSPNSASSSAASSSAATGSARGASGNRGPAAAGQIAAVSGTTMQVQSQQNGQVAVTWTGSTKFTQQISVAASAVKVGSCVTAVGGSGTSSGATSFTATTVIVTPAASGACTGGAFPSGARPSGFPSGARPSGFPTGARPSGFPTGAGPSGRARVGSIASGKVTAVSGSTLTIAARDFRSSSTTNKTVTVAATTKVSTQAAATSKALAVGRCVAAQGKADSSGTVAATRVQITNPTGGQCTVGFGRLGNGG